MFLKTFLKRIINFIFCIWFLILSFLYILIPKNLNLILRSKLIILISDGGFGHTFTVPDILRYSSNQDEKILLITLFDGVRYNKFLTECFDIPFINIQTSTGKTIYKFIKKKFGEYENSEFKCILKSFNFLLIKILNKKILSRTGFYEYSLQKFKNENSNIDLNRYNFKGFSNYEFAYYYNIEFNKKKKPNLDHSLINKVNKNLKKLIKNKKRCTLYLRKRDGGPETTMRNGGNVKTYKPLIDYLISKNYTVFLVGEADWYIDELNLDNFSVIDYKIANLERDLFQIYAGFNCDLFISECGGFKFFGYYAPIAIGINYFPYGLVEPNFIKISYKKILKNKKILDYAECFEKFWFNSHLADKDPIKYKILNNSSEDILNLIKQVNI
jgi:putative glycosyltransferase (TIGR04372 family)